MFALGRLIDCVVKSNLHLVKLYIASQSLVLFTQVNQTNHNQTIMSADAVISEVAKGGHELKHAETVDKSAPKIDCMLIFFCLHI